MKKYEQRLVCGNQYNVSMKSLKIFKSNKKWQKTNKALHRKLKIGQSEHH
jgi:hypothetical protein